MKLYIEGVNKRRKSRFSSMYKVPEKEEHDCDVDPLEAYDKRMETIEAEDDEIETAEKERKTHLRGDHDSNHIYYFECGQTVDECNKLKLSRRSTSKTDQVMQASPSRNKTMHNCKKR